MIQLEPLQKEDFHKIVEWNEGRSSDFLVQWSGPFYKYPLTEEQLDQYFSDYVFIEKDTLFVFKIINLETNEIIGTIEIDEKDIVNKIGRVARFLIGEEKYRGKGIGKKALIEVLKFGFQKLKLNKITLGVYDFNTSAIACYKNVGFSIEELKKDCRKVENGYWSMYDMAITYEQWRNKYGFK